MSYDIYFIKSKNLNQDNIEELIESEVSSSDEHFISREEMDNLKDSVASIGYEYELYEHENEEYYFEMSFKNYRLSVFQSQAVISVPYWPEIVDDSLGKEIEAITQVFINKGFSGYDQQTGQVFTSGYLFLDSFKQNLEIVVEDINKIKDNKPFSWIIYLIGVLLIALIFVLWKLIF